MLSVSFGCVYGVQRKLDCFIRTRRRSVCRSEIYKSSKRRRRTKGKRPTSELQIDMVSIRLEIASARLTARFRQEGAAIRTPIQCCNNRVVLPVYSSHRDYRLSFKIDASNKIRATSFLINNDMIFMYCFFKWQPRFIVVLLYFSPPPPINVMVDV